MRRPAAVVGSLLTSVVLTGPSTRASQEPDAVERLTACMASADFVASHDCAGELVVLTDRHPELRREVKVHLAFAARLRQDVAEFQAWRDEVSKPSEADQKGSEYEDGSSTAMLLPAAVSLLPYAGAESTAFVAAMLDAATMSDDLESAIASHGGTVLPAVLAHAGSDQPWRRAVGYTVLGMMLAGHADAGLASPLTRNDHDAAATAVMRGLQDREPELRRTAIRAARTGRVGRALPMLRVMAATEPHAGPRSIGQAAADAVSALTR